MTWYMVRNADGMYIGRVFIEGPVSWVAKPFGSCFVNLQNAEQVAKVYGGVVVDMEGNRV